MPRLPDIPLNDWRQDQQDRFQKQTDGLFPSLEFELGAKDAESQIPPDYDAVGGRDQWEEAERQRMADEYRRQQQEAEDRQRQEAVAQQAQIDAQAEQYRQMQASGEAQAQAQEQQRSSSVMDLIKGLGIPTPGDAFSQFEPQPDHTSSALFDSDQGPHEQPYPGTVSPIQNPDGSITTERSITVTEPGLQEGRPTNIPTVWSGRVVSDDEAIQNAINSRRSFPSYASIDEAVSAAEQRSQDIGSGRETSVGGAHAPESLSDVDQFNQFAGGLQTDAFGAPTPDPAQNQPPTPDHTSTSGIFDQLGDAYHAGQDALTSGAQAVRRGADELGTTLSENPLYQTVTTPGGLPDVVNLARRADEGAGYIVENYGLGHNIQQENRRRELLDEAGVIAVPGSPREMLNEQPPEAWRQANPEKADELDRINQEREALVMGASGTMGGGGLADDALTAIKAVIKAGFQDEALAMERKLAETSSFTLAQIQERTRGIQAAASDIPGGALTDEERALNEAADARARAAPPHSGYLEDPEFGADIPDASPSPTPYTRGAASEAEQTTPVSPYHRGLTPEEARQYQLPGFEDSAVRGAGEERRPYTNLKGFGTLPESTVRGEPGAMPTEVEDEISRTLRETVFDQTPLTGEERQARLAELWKVDPNRIHGWFDEAPTVDPKMAGVKQEALKTRVRELGDQWDNARIEFGRVKAEIDAVQGAGNKVGDDLAQEAAYWGTEFARTNLELKNAVLGQKLGASAAAQALNAQRGGRLGAYVLSEARRLDDVGNASGEAAAVAKRVARRAGGEITPEDEGALRKIADKLGSARTVRSVTRRKSGEELDKLAGGSRGGGRRGTAGPQEPRLPPRDETIAERLGRLQREDRDLLTSGADDAARAEVRGQIDDLLAQVSERAQESARRRLTTKATTPAMTAADDERAINEALGRRAMGQVRAAVNKQEGRTLLGRTADDLTRRVDATVRRFVMDDPEKLQAAIDRQLQRRIDGALATEQRASIRTEVRDMAKEAQRYAKELRSKPQELNDLAGQHNEREFDLILRRMTEHSNVGERVANEMRERLWDQVGRSITRQEEQGYQAGQRAITESRIRGVKMQLQQVLDNPRMPDRHLRVAELYKDLAEISDSSKKMASEMRQQAWTRGIQKSGLFAEDTDTSKLIEMMSSINPKDPTTLRPILEVMVRPSLWQVAREISFINLLSSPVTHFTNISSTIANGMLRLMLRNPIEWAASGGRASGKAAAFEGLARSLGEGVRLAAKTELSGYNPRRLESALATGDYRHIGREVVPQVMAKYGMGKLGEAWHMMSTRPLEAMDALMGHAMFSSSVYELAQKKADDLIRAGRQGIDRVRLRDEILNTIWDHEDIIKKAGKIEDYTLFRSREKGPFESKLRLLMGIKEVDPDAPVWQKGMAALADFIMPFWNVPYNFTKQGVSNVFGFPIEGARALKAYSKGEVEQAGEHVGKAVQGLGMMGIPILLSSGDNLTGQGPEDTGDRRVWMENHRPYSWRIPGSRHWISYEGTPWAVPFSTVAGATEAMKFQKKDPEASDLERAAGVGLGAVGGGIRGALSQSFVEAAMRNFQALTGDISGPQAGANMLASTALRYSPHLLAGVPPSAMLNFLGTMVDAVERDTGRAHNLRDIPEVAGNMIKARLPVARETLEPRRGAYGEEVRNERQGISAILPRSMSGQSTPNPDDPITKNLEDLGVGIPTVSDTLTINKQDVPLTIKEQQRFQALYGQSYRTILEKIEAEKTRSGKTYPAEAYERLRSRARDVAEAKLKQEIGTQELMTRLRRTRSLAGTSERR